MTNKRVLYSQRVEVIESYMERRDCADQSIAQFIRACGYLPIPVNNIPSIADEMVRDLEPTGIILTGGNSLLKHGGNTPEKDETDKVLIQLALELDIPLYGFCRGMQSILDYFKTELIQVTGHVRVNHVVRGDLGEFCVNSFHNQAAKTIEHPLIVLARSEDGIIEAVRHVDKRIMGTMWHPEREVPYKESDILRIKNLFENKR